MRTPPPKTGPKILVFDIETAPMLAYVWGLWEQNVSLNQIHTDWYVLAWSAKWLGDSPTKTMYMDQRTRKGASLERDLPLLRGIWRLLDKADIVITQNGKAFDQKKLNARFILNGMQPPSSYRHIDTCELAKRHFGFTSNKLAYLSDKLCTRYKKLSHAKYSGFDLWRACLSGDQAAWQEMETYNKHDVLALEELYGRLAPWDTSLNFQVYRADKPIVCKCGSDRLHRRGFYYTNTGRFQKFRCRDCGHETRSRKNQIKAKQLERTAIPR